MNPLRKTRAGVYARQSHASKRSVDEQIAACLKDAAAEGYDVVGRYQDLVSASRHTRKQRDDWPRLLTDVEGGRIDVVVMWESSRGDRDLTSWSAFLDLCRQHKILIRITDDSETYDLSKPKHWRRLASDGVSNAAYSDETSQRCKRTALSTAEAGRPNGPAPYGYRRVYNPVTRDLVEQQIVDEQAAAVVEVFERVAAGEPVSDIAADLKTRGVPSPGQWRANRPWAPNPIRSIIRNPSYIGQRRHAPKEGSGGTYPSEVIPKIVEDDVYWKANRVLDDRALKFYRAPKAEHVLSGVPICDHCGGKYSGSVNSTGRGGPRYQCRGCGSVIQAGDFEDLVLAYVLGRLARKDVYSKLRRAGAEADQEMKAARTEAAKLRAQLDGWRDSAVRAETTPASLAKIERDLTKLIDAADRKAERAGVPPAVRDLIDAGNELPERWAAMPLAARRDVVAALVDVVVVKGRRGVKVPVKDRVKVTWKGTE